jgi:ADP-ribose pyrophosphatase YjhB (NUDIX family)
MSVPPGETARQAAVRELVEKTGIEAVDLDFVAVAECALRAGPSLSRLAVDSGADDLLALSQDHSRVTPVDCMNNVVAPSQMVPGYRADHATRLLTHQPAPAYPRGPHRQSGCRSQSCDQPTYWSLAASAPR